MKTKNLIALKYTVMATVIYTIAVVMFFFALGFGADNDTAIAVAFSVLVVTTLILVALTTTAPFAIFVTLVFMVFFPSTALTAFVTSFMFAAFAMLMLAPNTNKDKDRVLEGMKGVQLEGMGRVFIFALLINSVSGIGLFFEYKGQFVLGSIILAAALVSALLLGWRGKIVQHHS